MLSSQVKAVLILITLALNSLNCLAGSYDVNGNNPSLGKCTIYIELGVHIGSTITWSGACSNGFANGHGTFTVSRSGQNYYKYVGEMKDGMTVGIGTLTNSLGEDMVGEFSRLLPDGFIVKNGRIGYYEKDYLKGELTECTSSAEVCIANEKEKVAKAKAKADKEYKNEATNRERRVAAFRKSLREGDDTSRGVVVQVKGNLVKIQTNDTQCTQRDYDGNCRNYVDTPVEKWFKRSEVYPSN